MKQEDLLRFLSNNLERYNINIHPLDLIGKKVCIAGDDDEKEIPTSSLLIVSTVTSIVFGTLSGNLDLLAEADVELTYLHLANGGKIILASNKPGRLIYKGLNSFFRDELEYNAFVYFID